MKLLTGFAFILVFPLALPGCIKNNLPTREDILPPITQTGANTFGCLINGNVWVPKGFSAPFSNYRVIVDPYFVDGNLDIRVYRVKSGIREDLSIASDSIKSVGKYYIFDIARTSCRFYKSSDNFTNEICDIYYGGIFNRSGYINITRYDLINGIISGEFEIKMVNKECGYGDTIKISDGRFDSKL
jgi:hypothetical protein